MNIIYLDVFFRKVINYSYSLKLRLKNDAAIHKIYIFTSSIVNQLTI
jgi:hypothetical protein